MKDEPGQDFSDELLNAFVDDELSVADKEYVYHAMNTDEELRRRVFELRELRDLTRTAYSTVETETRSKPVPGSPVSGLRWAVNVAILVVGVAIGYGLASYAPLSTPASDVRSAQGVTAERTYKVLFNINRNDPDALRRVLDQAELLLSAKNQLSHPVLVRVVAHLDGLPLFEVGTSPYPDRIRRLHRDHHDYLVFSACMTTQRLRQAAGETVEVLPEVIMVDSGIHEVVRRQREGWTHIQI